MNKFTYQDFYNQWNGKSSSLGGNYNQCVTLFKEFLKKAGYPSPERAIGGSGGAKEIWHRRNALGYGDYFTFEQVGHPGDWFVWDSNYGWYEGVYYGHVAMLIKDNGNGTGQFLGMNQDTNLSPAHVVTLAYKGSCGVLHYKGYSSTQASFGEAIDQILHVGSHVTFATNLIVDAINVGQNLVHCNRLGGWVSANICRETSARDGKNDQILNVGAQFTIDGRYTVSKVDTKNDLVFLKELGFWVKAEPLTEVA